MYKAYKFRLCPNNNQKELIHKTFGCTRFIYNYFLNECRENGYQKAYNTLSKLINKKYKISTVATIGI